MKHTSTVVVTSVPDHCIVSKLSQWRFLNVKDLQIYISSHNTSIIPAALTNLCGSGKGELNIASRPCRELEVANWQKNTYRFQHANWHAVKTAL